MSDRRPEVESFARLAGTIRTIVMKNGPAEAQAILCGAILTNLVGPIPDDFWTEMMRQASLPCGQIDCRCEKLRSEVMAAFDKQRTDWREQMGQA